MAGRPPSAYAQTRADIQTERTYGSIAHAAMKWVPVLNIVLTVVFYALFPVLFPLFLMPRSGPYALKGYLTGFFYLAAWGPLYVILHMVMMFKGAAEVAGASSGSGLTLASFTGMSEANDDIGLLAGYLVASIPFLAGGIARGAMAISSQATSYLNPSQNAAEEAAREVSTGNIALGNSSFDNQTVQTRQHDQWNQAPSFTYGAAQTRAFNDTGTLSTSFAGNQLLDVPVSKLPFMPQVTQSVAAEAAKVASETRSRGETLSNQAVQSTSNAVTRFQEFRHAMSTDRSVSDSYGNDDRAVISEGFNEVNRASEMLQNRFGLRAEVADTIATEKFLTGTIGVDGGVGGSIGIGRLGASIGVTGGASKRWSATDVAAVSKDSSRIAEALASWSSDRGWTHSRDSFERSAETTSRSDVASRTSGKSFSATRAQTESAEARRYFEDAHRIEQRWSTSSSQSVSGVLNASDEFLQFARQEIATTPLVYKRFDPASATDWSSTDVETSGERDLLVQRFVEHVGERIRSEVHGRVSEIDGAGLRMPEMSPVNASSPAISPEPTRPSGQNVRNDVQRALGDGRRNIERRSLATEGHASLDGVELNRGGTSQVRDWGRRQ